MLDKSSPGDDHNSSLEQEFREMISPFVQLVAEEIVSQDAMQQRLSSELTVTLEQWRTSVDTSELRYALLFLDPLSASSACLNSMLQTIDVATRAIPRDATW
jgi:hypothetical protein